jgi:PiT family inorganic phosphate transporter
MVAVGLVMALGGWVGARRVAEVMSQRITSMDHAQAFTANLATGMIVIGASRFGWPVSTTHVSCGALFGIGVVSHCAQWSTIGKIVTAWVTTLPIAAALGAMTYRLLS